MSRLIRQPDTKLILPTFLMPGAGKSGTSYLAKVLQTHPDIFIPSSKEPAFFSTAKHAGTYHKGVDYYQKNFFGYKGEKHVGEASTVYMYDPDSPRLIHQYIPGVRLIFILRNPLERVYSNYWGDIKSGKDLPDFKELVFKDDIRIENMIHVSRYDIHLKRYMAYFNRTQILVLLYDDLRRDELHTVNSVLTFLGLEAFPEDKELGSRVNPSAKPRSRSLARLLRSRALIQAVKGVVPGAMVGLLRQMLMRIRNYNQKPFAYPPMDRETWDYLSIKFDRTISELSHLLGRDLSMWLDYDPQ